MYELPDIVLGMVALTRTTATTLEVIPPALLARAREIAAEHKQLSEKLTNGFDTRAAKRMGESGPIVNALGDWEKANEVRCALSGSCQTYA